jgi:hypothetical protein
MKAENDDIMAWYGMVDDKREQCNALYHCDAVCHPECIRSKHDVKIRLKLMLTVQGESLALCHGSIPHS